VRRISLPFAVLAALALAVGGTAQESPRPLSAYRVHVVAVAPGASTWPQSIADFTQRALWTPADLRTVTTADSSTNVCSSLPAVSNAVTVCVDFGNPPASAGPAWEFKPERRCGAVRVEALKPVEIADPVLRDSTWQLRVQKQTAFVAARLLGKIECPFMLCLMHGDQNMEDLDFKARSMCPPCEEEMLRLLGLPD
jgi:hypothetical protein